MNAEELRARQAPFKTKYREDPDSGTLTMTATGVLDVEALSCRVASSSGEVVAGLHPAAGGDGSGVCAGDLLLQALVACAGVTLAAVATATETPVRSGTISAEGDLDFRGTLGVDKGVPVGFLAIRLRFEIETDADEAQVANLIRLSERYCVVYQTLRIATALSSSVVAKRG
jgi:uncharacterized OsmC-like protein